MKGYKEQENEIDTKVKVKRSEIHTKVKIIT